MVLFHLPWKLLEDLLGKFNSVIVVALELDKLNEVAHCLVALRISHQAVIVVQFMHCAPILSISNSDDDNTQGELATLHK
jgi:hypothetical protein